MKFPSKLSALAALLALTLPATASANLILNGSFEAPALDSGTITTFGVGSTAITGWTVLGVDSSIISGDHISSLLLLQAQAGQQWLDLTGPGTNSSANGISQNIATLVGQTYALSFYVGSATENATLFASTVDVSIAGSARVSYTNPTAPTTQFDWQLFTVQFTATSPTTEIAFYNGSENFNHLSALDNVAVTAIPEPSTYALLFGGSILGWVVYRRRR